MKKKINERIDWLLFRMGELQDTQSKMLEALISIKEKLEK